MNRVWFPKGVQTTYGSDQMQPLNNMETSIPLLVPWPLAHLAGLTQRAAERRQSLAPAAGSPRGHPAWGACASKASVTPGSGGPQNQSREAGDRKYQTALRFF